MRPHLNPNLHNPSNGVPINRSSFPSPQQIRPQFQGGMTNSHHLTVTPFTNQTNPFTPIPYFPLAQLGLQNPNANYFPMLHNQNSANIPQFMPNGQFNAQSLLQSANQILQMQLANLGTQNLGLLLNSQLSMMNGNGVMQQGIGGNASMQMHPNNVVANDFGSAQVQQMQSILPTNSAQLQEPLAKEMNERNSNMMKPHKDFNGNYRYNDSNKGYGTKQFHDRPFVKSFKNNNGNREKGRKNIGTKNFNSPFDQSQEGKKRPLAAKYTDKEIQEWLNDRKKNYPSKANMKKKLNEIPAQEAKDDAGETRRQQLKEILAKQAELGCEVAEIPSHYLAGSELRRNGSQQNNLKCNKRERFGNKFGKRGGKRHQNGRFQKRQKFEDTDPADLHNQNDGPCTQQTLAHDQLTEIPKDIIKSEPSLLRKLLSSDIKKDNKHLLQAFRFMVMNSFFENPSETPLKFPTVTVKESGENSDSIDDNKHLASGDRSTIGCS